MITLVPKRKLENIGDAKPLSFDYSKQDTQAVENKLHTVGYSIGATRAWDTTYQNASGRIRVVTVSCIFNCLSNNGATITALIGRTSTPGTTANRIALHNNLGDITLNLYAILSMTFIVPNGWYYQCASSIIEGTPTYTKLDWGEYDFHSAAPQTIV